MTKKEPPLVTLIGGLTIDLTYRVNRWPRVERAVQATSYSLTPGGKGLNQATAVARMGLKTQLIGSVGNDAFADEIFKTLSSEKINHRNIIKQENTPTDLIGIIVKPDGKPGFIGIKTATSKLTARDVEKRKSLIKNSQVLLVNSEVSTEAVVKALEIAKQAAVTTIFNPAPPSKLPKRILRLVDYFVPNEWEARVLHPLGSRLSLSELAEKYREMGTKVACITMGENGCIVASDKGTKPYLAFPVDEVETTGAGDAFCGVLAYTITQQWNLDKSIRFASAAGALVCTRGAVQDSIPTLKQVSNFLKAH